jgi:hypothetical protein
LANDYERLPRTLEGLDVMVIACLMLSKMVHLLGRSS